MIPRNPGTIGENPAVIVIDPQVDFVDGEISIDDDPDAFVDNVNALVNAARDADVPVIWSKESHRRDHADFGVERYSSAGEHTMEGTAGEAYVSDLDVDIDDLNPAEYHVTKRRYDLFYGTDLEHLLDTYDIDTVVLAGVTTHVCVHYTAHGAHNRDFVVRVVEECTADRDDWHEIGLRSIAYLQPDSVVTLADVTEALAEFDGNDVVRSVKETGSVFGESGV